MRLLKLTGFEPVLDHCTLCKTPMTNGNSYCFYPRDGGIKCSVCAWPKRYDRYISAGTLRTLFPGKDMIA
jgi:recombinational DNA repair protein (RecF pathway)